MPGRKRLWKGWVRSIPEKRHMLTLYAENIRQELGRSFLAEEASSVTAPSANKFGE